MALARTPGHAIRARGPRARRRLRAGRVSLYLQRKGLTVTAIDNSPLAIRVCRTRGVKDVRVLAIEQIGRLAGAPFDTVVMLGNNFGLFGASGKRSASFDSFTASRARTRCSWLNR